MKWGPVRVLEQTSMKNLCALEGVEKSVGLGRQKQWPKFSMKITAFAKST